MNRGIPREGPGGFLFAHQTLPFVTAANAWFSNPNRAAFCTAAAKLRLFVTDLSPSGGQFRHVPDNSWAEGSVTWSNAPAASSTNTASLGAVSTGTWVKVDVFSLVKGDGTYSLRISSTN